MRQKKITAQCVPSAMSDYFGERVANCKTTIINALYAINSFK